MAKLKVRIIIFLILIVTAVFCISIYLPHECDTLMPVEASRIDNKTEYKNVVYKWVTFLTKKHISSEKWGFKRQVTFTNKAVFNMISDFDNERYYNKGIKYGIYEDELLTKPIKEADLDRVLYSEETGEKCSSAINIVLEPGKYYVGMTANWWFVGTFLFITDYAYIYDEYELIENKECRYYNNYEKGDVYFKITDLKEGIIKVNTKYNSIQLCDENKRPISEFTDCRRYGEITARYKLMKNHIYYIRQSVNNIKVMKGYYDTIAGNSIKYNYVN